MYLRIKNRDEIEYPFNLEQLRQEHPNVSFPDPISDELLAEHLIFHVEESSTPEVRYNQNLIKIGPTLKNGKWVILWDVVDASPEDVMIRIEAAAEDARLYRNKYLADSDWTQLSDVSITNKEEWKIYRQKLRDISKQEGFPFNIVWPEIPYK